MKDKRAIKDNERRAGKLGKAVRLHRKSERELFAEIRATRRRSP